MNSGFCKRNKQMININSWVWGRILVQINSIAEMWWSKIDGKTSNFVYDKLDRVVREIVVNSIEYEIVREMYGQ